MSNAKSSLDLDYTLSPHSRFLKKYGMYSAALFYKNMNETLERRAARALRYRFEELAVPFYNEQQRLFVNSNHRATDPVADDDRHDYACYVNFDGMCIVNSGKFEKLTEFAGSEQEKFIVASIIQNSQNMYHESMPARYLHYGIHNIVDFEYLLKHGFYGYKNKILSELSKTAEEEKTQFLEGMLDVVEGIINFINRYKASLKEYSEKNPSEEIENLLTALEQVPLNPAANFYEAYITMDAAMYFSNCFECGRIDSLLYPYYEKDVKEGKLSKEEAISFIRELLMDIDKREGHPGTTHVTIGGTKPDGTADYNELTDAVMIAVRGLRAPNVSLRVRTDMPQTLWDTYIENIGGGCAQPAIVNEQLFLDGLVKQYNVPFEDATQYAFGGCSEVLIQGKTMCDSTWVSYNMLDVFEQTMYNNLTQCDTFEQFYHRIKQDIGITLKEMENQIDLRQHSTGCYIPFPVRTLMTGDCIENAKSHSNGGARYNFDSTNIYGTTNTINSLYTIKKFFEGAFGDFDKETFLKCFMQNFEGYEDIYRKCVDVTKFGNYNEEINAITSDIMSLTFNQINSTHCHRGNGYFMPAMILWVTWVSGGSRVGATPDGRRCSEPLADSAGPMQGTDTEGPTSTMGATLAIPQTDCVGTCILNLRLDSSNFKSQSSRKKVQHLFESYFLQGGCQLQVNVVDTKVLLDALEHPEKHRDIIVRVGGFSDNFVMLDNKIKEQVILRSIHSVE